MSAERPAKLDLDGQGLHIAIACSRFNQAVTGKLLAGAERALDEHGVDEGHRCTFFVPGAFELPVVAKRLAGSGSYDAVIALGAVIRGATGHYELVASQAAAGIARASLDTGVPVIFGVLAADTFEQALERAGGSLGNRGEDAALAAIEMALLMRRLPGPSPTGQAQPGRRAGA